MLEGKGAVLDGVSNDLTVCLKCIMAAGNCTTIWKLRQDHSLWMMSHIKNMIEWI